LATCEKNLDYISTNTKNTKSSVDLVKTEIVNLESKIDNLDKKVEDTNIILKAIYDGIFGSSNLNLNNNY
jgi:peptidoglycan hydrolase CwlO-like protein